MTARNDDGFRECGPFYSLSYTHTLIDMFFLEIPHATFFERFSERTFLTPSLGEDTFINRRIRGAFTMKGGRGGLMIPTTPTTLHSLRHDFYLVVSGVDR